MSDKLKVALLYGGRSGEHEISLLSAASVFLRLSRQRYEVVPIAIDKDGKLYLNDHLSVDDNLQALPVKSQHSKPLPGILIDGKFVLDVDVVFPVMHGPLCEDGSIQGALRLAGVAMVGCDVLSSAIGMDKDMTRRVACRPLEAPHFTCTDYEVLSIYQSDALREQSLKAAAEKFGWPVFVKPTHLGSSVGIHKARDMQALKIAVNDAFRYDDSVLIEKFTPGREIEISVLENPNPGLPPLVSLAGEIKVNHPDGFYSYTAKYLESDSTDLIIPANLSEEMLARIQDCARAIFTRLKCKGMARVDFFVDGDTILLNEVNTIPGFTSISMYPKMWERSGLAYEALLDSLIEVAMTHARMQKQLVTDYL